jgi:uncharacterized repeat protein (TIGR03803 family)
MIVAAMFLPPAAWAANKYKVLHNFGPYSEGSDGSMPSGPLTLDGQGNLYGETLVGGTGECGGYGCGVVFELTPGPNGQWSEQILYDFPGGTGAAFPSGGLVIDGSGNLYGTVGGEPDGTGGVFELTPGSGGWALSILYDNSTVHGLLLDNAGNLYGEMGLGEYKEGAIGELSPGSNGWVYTVLYSFCGQHHGGICDDGNDPLAPPIWGGNNLYGTTYYGGVGHGAGYGVVYGMTPNGDGTWTYQVLHHFGSFHGDGQYPDGGLAVDASGTLYGATVGGGTHGNGRVFKLAGSQWKETSLYDFPSCANGCAPIGTMALDKAGNLYGVTAAGGSPDCQGGCGVVFELSPQRNGTWKYGVLHKFDGTDGNGPLDVILDGKGNLFGVTESGGTNNGGVAFEITP